MMEYRHFIENSPTSILVVRDEKILYANPAFLFFPGTKMEKLSEMISSSLLLPQIIRNSQTS